MRAYSIFPETRQLANGATVLAHFEAEIARGVIARLSLVRSGRDGADMVWSNTGPRGPALRLAPHLQASLAAQVRRELAAMRAALDEAA